MDMRVVVVRPFGPHARGDVLTDASEVAKILAGEHARDVVRVAPPAAPAAAAVANAKGS